jgi:hypothetical protein
MLHYRVWGTIAMLYYRVWGTIAMLYYRVWGTIAKLLTEDSYWKYDPVATRLTTTSYTWTSWHNTYTQTLDVSSEAAGDSLLQL